MKFALLDGKLPKALAKLRVIGTLTLILQVLTVVRKVEDTLTVCPDPQIVVVAVVALHSAF